MNLPNNSLPSVRSFNRVCGSLIIAAGLLTSACLSAAPATKGTPAPATNASLIVNGDFEVAGTDTMWPDGWARPSAGEPAWVTEDGNHFIRLRASAPGQTLILHRIVALPAAAKALKFSVRVRVTDITPGAQPWFDARIVTDFKSGTGAKIKGAKTITFRKDTDWVERTVSFLVPEGAVSLEVMPSLFQVEAGTFDLDDLSLVVIDPMAVSQPAK
jgi:hypothetical protein